MADWCLPNIWLLNVWSWLLNVWSWLLNIWSWLLNIWSWLLNIWSWLLNVWSWLLNIWSWLLNIWSWLLNIWSWLLNVWSWLLNVWMLNVPAVCKVSHGWTALSVYMLLQIKLAVSPSRSVVTPGWPMWHWMRCRVVCRVQLFQSVVWLSHGEWVPRPWRWMPYY